MSLIPGPPPFCPHCGGAIGAKHGDDYPVLTGFHTVDWPDGFRITRLGQDRRRSTLWIEVQWQGLKRRLRLTKRLTEVQSP